MNARTTSTVLFVWGTYQTAAPPRPEDQRIIRDVREAPNVREEPARKRPRATART